MKLYYQKQPLHFSIYTRSCARYIFKFLDLKEGERFLDIGFGSGYYVSRIDLEGNGVSIHGIETDYESVKLVAKNFKGSFLHANAEKLPYKDGSFNKILCASVMEHLKDDESLLREIVRVSKDGTEVIICVPSLDGLRSKSRLRNLGHDDPYSSEYHFRSGYTKGTLMDLLEKYGIQIIDVKYSLVLISEFVMDIIKLIYIKTNRFESQTNIQSVKDSRLFKIYKILFPLILAIGYIEDLLLVKFFKGHIITLKARVMKK